MKRPRIFAIQGIDTDICMPIESAMIIYHTVDIVISKCPKCGWEDDVTTSYLLEGFDDFHDGDLSQIGFLGCDFLPLFARRDLAQKIVESLSGASYAKVGYYIWNQDIVLRKSERFTKEPLIGAVEVTGRCKGGFLKATGKPLDVNCELCKEMYLADGNNDVEIDDVLLDYSQWDGSDIFNVEVDCYTTIITEEGRSKLEYLGFKNLIYQEVFWKE